MPRVDILEKDQIPQDKQQFYDEIAKYRGHVAPVSYTHLTLPTNREV